MDLDEYLKELKKELTDPEEYIVEGFYELDGKKNGFTGILEIDTNGRVIGKIQNVEYPLENQMIVGDIKYGGIREMNIIGVFIDSNDAVYYSFKKHDNTDREEIDGTYEGLCKFNEPDVRESENKARINVHRKIDMQ